MRRTRNALRSPLRTSRNVGYPAQQVWRDEDHKKCPHGFFGGMTAAPAPAPPDNDDDDGVPAAPAPPGGSS